MSSLPVRPLRKLTSETEPPSWPSGRPVGAAPPPRSAAGSRIGAPPPTPFLPPPASDGDVQRSASGIAPPPRLQQRLNRRSRSLLALRDAMTPEEQQAWLVSQQPAEQVATITTERDSAGDTNDRPEQIVVVTSPPPPPAVRPRGVGGGSTIRTAVPPRLQAAQDGDPTRSSSLPGSSPGFAAPLAPPRPGRAGTLRQNRRSRSLLALKDSMTPEEQERWMDEQQQQQQDSDDSGDKQEHEREGGDDTSTTTGGDAAPAGLPLLVPRGLRRTTVTQRPQSRIPEERKLVVHELVVSESRYVQDLALIRTLFVEPIRKNKMLELREFGMLFSNIEIIEQANTELLRELEKLVMQSEDLLELCLGEVFLRNIENLLPIYTPYCLNQAQSVETYEKLIGKKGAPFAEYVKRMMLDPRAQGLPLMSYLIKPVQRLCKYPLLLRELLGKTNNSHPDRKPLEAALLQTNALVVQVNESKRAAENLRKLLHIDRLVDKKQNLKIVTPGRWFIKEGRLIKRTHGRDQERQFFLFSDMLMWAKSEGRRTEFKGFVFLNRSALSDAGSAVEHGFYITRSDTQKRYLIHAKDVKEKKEWWVALQNAIQESWVEEAAKEERAAPAAASSSSSSSSSSSALAASLSPSSATSTAFTIQQSDNALSPEEVLKMVDVENRIVGFSNTVRNRRLVREGPAKIKDKDCYLFLFSDLIIVTRRKSAKVYTKKIDMPLRSLIAQHCPAPESVSLIAGRRTAVIVTFASAATAAEWVVEMERLSSS